MTYIKKCVQQSDQATTWASEESQFDLRQCQETVSSPKRKAFYAVDTGNALWKGKTAGAWRWPLTPL